MAQTEKSVLVFDYGEGVADRYTVVYRREYCCGKHYWPYVSMCGNPFHPLGIGMHGELDYPPNRDGALGVRIPFDALPEDCKKLARQDLA